MESLMETCIRNFARNSCECFKNQLALKAKELIKSSVSLFAFMSPNDLKSTHASPKGI